MIGLGAYALRAIAWPATVGRDLDEYVYAYLQLFDRDVLLPWSLLFRTPVTPLVAGSVLDLAGGFFVEPVLAVLYAFSIVAWSRAALVFGRRAALVTAVALLLYHGYALMFHELSSEPMLAAAFAGFALALARAYERPTTGRFVLVGLAASVTVLARPGSIVLLVFVFLPLALRGTWRSRLRWSGAFTAAALVPLALWTLHNGLRFDYWGLARGGNAVIPLYRAFITDHIVRADNGPASRRLATAMQRDLLTREPYRAYGVTLDELFRKGSFRVHEDLYLLSDRDFGWDSNYAVLRNAGIEAVKAHPGAYASGVVSTIWDELSQAHFRVVAGTELVATPSHPAPEACRRPARGSRSRRARTRGSRGRTAASARSGRHRRGTALLSPSRASEIGSARSCAAATSSSKGFRTATGGPGSRCGSTSCRDGTRGRGSGSSSGSSRSPSAGRAEPFCCSPCRSERCSSSSSAPSDSSRTCTSCSRSPPRSSCSGSAPCSGRARLAQPSNRPGRNRPASRTAPGRVVVR